MRRIQKLLLGTFLGGVLLCGAGTGAALVEYSSFTYAGEKKIGWEDLTTKELDFSFDPEMGSIIVDAGYWTLLEGTGVEADETVPEGIIRLQVTYNEKRTEPFLEFYDFREGPGAERMETPEEPQGRLELMARYKGGDLEILMECKDQFLKELKERKISGYETAYITEVRILVNPASVETVRVESRG